MLHHWTTDWPDIIPRITLSTLVIGGAVSFINPDAQVWNNEHIKGSRPETFEGSGPQLPIAKLCAHLAETGRYAVGGVGDTVVSETEDLACFGPREGA